MLYFLVTSVLRFALLLYSQRIISLVVIELTDCIDGAILLALEWRIFVLIYVKNAFGLNVNVVDGIILILVLCTFSLSNADYKDIFFLL